MKQPLTSTYSFSIEPYKERIRLIVFKNENEFVCRKENIKNLTVFLSGENKQLFKGRLQLMKSEEKIFIQVKGEIIGEIEKAAFQKLLSNVEAI